MANELSELSEWFMGVAPRFALLLVRRHGIDYETAREALQTSIVRIMDRQHTPREVPGVRTLRPPLHFETRNDFERFLWISANYLALDERRRRLRMADETALTLLSAAGFSTEHELIRQERIDRLHEAIDSLDEHYRIIFKLLTEEELPMSKIAERLGIKVSSVYKRYERGLVKLGKLLRKH